MIRVPFLPYYLDWIPSPAYLLAVQGYLPVLLLAPPPGLLPLSVSLWFIPRCSTPHFTCSTNCRATGAPDCSALGQSVACLLAKLR